jgi:hypothetical protein
MHQNNQKCIAAACDINSTAYHSEDARLILLNGSWKIVTQNSEFRIQDPRSNDGQI